MKKLVALFMGVLFIFNTAFSVQAGSQDSYVSGKELSEDALAFLEKNGVVINDSSVIRITDVKQETESDVDNGQAIVIVNNNDGVETTEVVLMIDSEGNAPSICTADLRKVPTGMKAGGSADFPPLSWDGRYVIHAVAVYNTPGSSFYQPTGAYFHYTKYQTCTVSYIQVLYFCDGFPYTYPGLVDLNLSETVHNIYVTRYNPVAGTMYNTSNPYNSSRCLYTGSGSPFVGQGITFTATVNGSTTSYTVML